MHTACHLSEIKPLVSVWHSQSLNVSLSVLDGKWDNDVYIFKCFKDMPQTNLKQVLEVIKYGQIASEVA